MSENSSSLLAGLGIHGWDSVESAILAGLLLGEPFLLVSEPGSGKTFLGSVIASALGMSYGYYDVAKANFEDVLGFPNPAAFAEGRAEFVHNQLTIWDKQVVMVDEVSRAARDTSNKWLEVLGSRRLMGRQLPIRVLIGAMNPIEHQGTHALDEAFADRFLFFLRLPEFAGMDEQTRHRILEGRTGLDAPSVGFWAGREEAEQTHDYVISTPDFQRAAQALRESLRRSALLYRELEAGPLARQAADYVDLFARALRLLEVPLEPRRLKMIKRALLATWAAETARSGLEELSVESRVRCAALVAACCLPHPHTGQASLTPEQLQVAHGEASSALKGNPAELLLFQANEPAQKFALLLGGEYEPSVVAKVCADFAADPSPRADMAALALAPLLTHQRASQVMGAQQLDQLAGRYHQVKLSAQARPLLSPRLSQQLAQVRELNSLAERVSNDYQRLALAWAHAFAEENLGEIPTLYQQALAELIRASSYLRPLAEEWGLSAPTEPPSE